jgi:MoaA/NifB/PqqE/SkfB family radical SAM enzyme
MHGHGDMASLDGASLDEASLDGRFCPNPWTFAEIQSHGGVYVCCPTYSGNKEIGNIFEQSAEEIWNSYQAIKFREGVLNGSFCECDRQKCPYIVGGDLPSVEQARARQDLAGVDLTASRLATGPLWVKAAYDVSCNLWCPSCRNELIVAKKPEQERLRRVRDEFIVPFLKDSQGLILSGDGDPFGSNHYREVMQLTAERLPKLKISLHTNAVLLDERAWNDCRLNGRVVEINISIDAATAETYAYVRRGGDFTRLLGNLAFLSRLRRTGEVERLNLLFVVQAINFREMPDFVGLGHRFGADTVQFTLIDHWARGMSRDEYAAKKIWSPEHPEHADLIGSLKSQVLRDPIVRMDVLDLLPAGALPGEYRAHA